MQQQNSKMEQISYENLNTRQEFTLKESEEVSQVQDKLFKGAMLCVQKVRTILIINKIHSYVNLKGKQGQTRWQNKYEYK
jgi:transcriptional regulator